MKEHKQSTVQYIIEQLAQFSGTSQYHTYTSKVLLTDGVAWLIGAAGCQWFVNVIWSHQGRRDVQQTPFQVWTLQVNLETREGDVFLSDGNGHVLLTQYIPFTDFPLDTLTLWAVPQGAKQVVLLPSEY